MLKISLFLMNLQTSRANNSRIVGIRNAKFSGCCFYINTKIQRDFCVGVPIIEYNKRNIFLQNHAENEAERLNPFFFIKQPYIRWCAAQFQNILIAFRYTLKTNCIKHYTTDPEILIFGKKIREQFLQHIFVLLFKENVFHVHCVKTGIIR